jgi:hypothetical protein
MQNDVPFSVIRLLTRNFVGRYSKRPGKFPVVASEKRYPTYFFRLYMQNEARVCEAAGPRPIPGA